MNGSAVSAIAGVFGMIFVALTVLYLAIQIKSGVLAELFPGYFHARGDGCDHW